MAKRQPMRWSAEGAHLLLQVRCALLDDRLDELFREWYPEWGTSPPAVAVRPPPVHAPQGRNTSSTVGQRVRVGVQIRQQLTEAPVDALKPREVAPRGPSPVEQIRQMPARLPKLSMPERPFRALVVVSSSSLPWREIVIAVPAVPALL